MNLRLAPVYVRTYTEVQSWSRASTWRREGKKKGEKKGEESEKEREREERRQGRCLDNSCKVQLARMPTTSEEEDEGMQGEKGRPKGSMWRVRGNEKEKEKGGKEREREREGRGGTRKGRQEASRRRKKESVRITSATGPYKGASERAKERGWRGRGGLCYRRDIFSFFLPLGRRYG